MCKTISFVGSSIKKNKASYKQIRKKFKMNTYTVILEYFQ